MKIYFKVCTLQYNILPILNYDIILYNLGCHYFINEQNIL